jgi:3-hydroxyisobutyrate dehydrogenase-like beta-hydroxyacid dehydrogenase
MGTSFTWLLLTRLTKHQFGLGSMGLAMASNLQRHLATKKALSLIYSNRTMSRGSPLAALGGIPEPNFEKLVSECGIIFTMVIQSWP